MAPAYASSWRYETGCIKGGTVLCDGNKPELSADEALLFEKLRTDNASMIWTSR
jgi:hypothetical protein